MIEIGTTVRILIEYRAGNIYMTTPMEVDAQGEFERTKSILEEEYKTNLKHARRVCVVHSKTFETMEHLYPNKKRKP